MMATLGRLWDTLPTQEEEMLLESPKHLYRDLKQLAEELWVTLYRTENTWWCHFVTDDDDDGGVTSLSQALAAYRSTPQTTQDRVAMAAKKWQWSVSVLVDRWAQLARQATEFRDTWSKVSTEALTAELRELQDEIAHCGTSEEHMVELGEALAREKGAEVVARPESEVEREARVAASQARRATIARQWVWAALWLLQCLVAACDEAIAFPRELQSVVRDIEDAVESTNEVSPNVPKDSVVKVAVAERLWETYTCLAQDHLLGIIDDILDY